MSPRFPFRWNNTTRSRLLILTCTLIGLAGFAVPGHVQALTRTNAVIAAPSDVIVMVNGLNVRLAPSLRGKIIAKLALGEMVTPVQKSPDGRWWQISYNDQTAYIYAPFTKLAQPADILETPASYTTVSVVSGVLNVRAGPGTSYSAIGQLRLGSVLTTSGRKGAWWAITFEGKNAFIYAPFTRVVTGSTTPQATATPVTPTSTPQSAGSCSASSPDWRGSNPNYPFCVRQDLEFTSGSEAQPRVLSFGQHQYTTFKWNVYGIQGISLHIDPNGQLCPAGSKGLSIPVNGSNGTQDATYTIDSFDFPAGCYKLELFVVRNDGQTVGHNEKYIWVK